MSDPSAPAAIDLAREADFSLGPAMVRPSLRAIIIDSREDLLEPRVMQVLVALSRRRGEVVSRDDLVAQCWAGRVVGEDAIARPIAQIRRLGEESSAFRIETIPRVGYRLTASDAPAEAGAAPATIAVLPFADMSPGRDQEYLADGLAEALVGLLARNPRLRVAARTSSFAFKGLGRTVSDIARELGVAMLLEGSVRKSADKVRIAVQLIDAKTGFQVWSETFTRQLTDVFEIQDEISGAIAMRLQASIDGAAPMVQARTQTPAAYEAFLEGDFHLGKGDTGSWKLAQTFYQRAIDLDPRFAPAHARQAWAILREIDPAQQDFEHARKLIDRALDLQPDLPEALYVRGLSNFMLGATDPHDEAIERLARIAPDSPLTAMGRVRMLALRLDFTATKPFMDRLAAIDPLGADANVLIGLVLGNMDKSAEAIAMIQRVIPYNPQSVELRSVMATQQMLAGDHVGACRAFLDTLRTAPYDNRCRNWVAFMLGGAGFTEDAAAFAARITVLANYSGALTPGANVDLESLRPVGKGYYHWRKGDLASAKPFFEETYKSGPRAPAYAVSSPGAFRIPLIAARRQAGEMAAAAALEQEVRNDIAYGEAHGWAGATHLTYLMLLAGMTGDAKGFREATLNAKREHLELGLRSMSDVVLNPIRNTPEFAETNERLKACWAGRREDLLASGLIERARELIAGW